MFSNKIVLGSLLFIVILAALVGIYAVLGPPASATVAVGDTIKVNYTGTFTNGTVFDSSAGKQPLEFAVGSGQLIKGFDQAVLGMKLNEEKTVTIPPNDAYGQRNLTNIEQVPLSQLGNLTVKIGMSLTKSINGQRYVGTVIAISDNEVVVDFNPPLAGQTLVFKIKVVDIQKKSA